MKKVYIYRIESCSRRKLDAEKFSDYFKENNYKIVDNPKKADYIILVTCAYIDDLSETSLNYVKKFQRYDAELIVAGCLPGIDKEKLDKIFTGKTVVTKEIEKIDEIFKNNKIKFREMHDSNKLWRNFSERGISGRIDSKIGMKLFERLSKKIREGVTAIAYGKNSINFSYFLKFSNKTYYLRISRGCNCNCAYCAIKNAIGPLKSKPIDTCIKEFKEGIQKGYKNFIIAAEDIGSYGIDIQSSLPELLQEIHKIKGKYTIEIESIQPVWLIKYFDEIEKILRQGKINRLCSSIQSGSQRILKLMNRYSNIDKTKEIFQKIKNINPKIIFSTEYILGFPSESREEFRDTIELINEIKFDWIVIHPYSKREGIQSETIEPKVPEKEIRERIKILKEFFTKNGYRISKSPFSDSIKVEIKK